LSKSWEENFQDQLRNIHELNQLICNFWLTGREDEM